MGENVNREASQVENTDTVNAMDVIAQVCVQGWIAVFLAIENYRAGLALTNPEE